MLMKSVLFIIAVSLSPFLVTATASAQSLGEITRALGAGDTRSLAAAMDTEVELSLLEEENLYSRDQAVQKLSAFFAAHSPSGFSQVHQGSSKADDAEYCIGNLATADGSYRVYIYIAKKGDRMVLQELRFDRE
ncbi:uncharacterized protein DUF4783 [Neolewinella xylanilytica]|uniref:Uncharacterized protein DUF4783 n=1 Tax=Neolewinella xylanilytica TaxID=1514080 RepID=A0A2S6I315_9BACT|nr:DUF4783 domain-containing protein [Neolewinella xylanilytica]PPK85555.1 uncharacterized protein DUF4783 [Neolewinella xylanilytica]